MFRIRCLVCVYHTSYLSMFRITQYVWQAARTHQGAGISIGLEAPIPKMRLGDKTYLHVIYIYIYIYIHTYAYVYIYIYIQTSSNFRTILAGTAFWTTQEQLAAEIHTYIHIHIHIYTYTHIHVYMKSSLTQMYKLPRALRGRCGTESQGSRSRSRN